MTNQTYRPLEVTEKTSQAYKDGIRTLYKYMSYPIYGTSSIDKVECRRRVEALLHNGELYFATARELNDPFEASPHMRFPSTSPDELTKSVLDSFNLNAQKFGLSEEAIKAHKKVLSEKIQSGTFLPQMTGLWCETRESIRSNNPMCCFSAEKDSTLMWSYYSGGHTGICVHFDATKSPINGAERVIYSKEYPVLPFHLDADNLDILLTRMLLTKSLVWNHEREYRLINILMTPPSDKPKHILDDLFKWKTSHLAVINPKFIVGVTVGASMQDTEIENILSICHDRSIKIPVYQAKCQQDRFDLDFMQIA
jgi:hypothetical protein